MKTTKVINRLTNLLMGVALVGIGLMSFSGCAALSSKPPSALDSTLFDVVPTVTTKTNQVNVTNFVEQVVFTTNVDHQIITTTNVIPLVVPTYVTVPVTNYTFTTKQSTTDTAQALGAAVNIAAPGMGTLVSLGLGAVLSLWGWFRSGTFKSTSSSLVQQVETIREFVKALPNGAVYDNALVSFMQAHQTDTKTLTTVASLLANEVSNPDAKVAAQQIIDTVNGLRTTSTPVAPVKLT